ncbi:50S ribosomal protein L4, sunset domain variant [Nocardioides sp. GXZ039]|uniref:50S ribosomal protein L4, sunset domain variant n=1 Tax=Nocardioides sp. GXZ039 TaxID=3136018 RepID=UPI0030F40648
MAAKNDTAKTVAVDLPAAIFDVEVNVPLIHQVVVAQQAAARQGTHATKTRGEVRGGGRKPYKQKGTGRARQGSTRAPQFAGGGTVHGPQPRDYSQRTPKKMKAAALRGALSDRARHERIHVVESLITGEVPSTKAALAALTGLSPRGRFLVVLERSDALTWLSLRNAVEVHIVAVDQLNTYDVLAADDVVFTQGAYEAFVSGATDAGAAKSPAAKAPAAKAPATKAAADEAAADEAPAIKGFAAVADADIEGGAQPGPDGEAPEGYDIKGNKDSMKYHAPGGQWYDATVAEVWFKTPADAEAAGFVEAGSKESIAQSHEEDEK